MTEMKGVSYLISDSISPNFCKDLKISNISFSCVASFVPSRSLYTTAQNVAIIIIYTFPNYWQSQEHKIVKVC